MKCVVVQAWALVLFVSVSISASWPASSQTVVIPAGSAWRYLDDGSDPGTAWRETSYDDSGWSNGVARFGFGGGDELTLLRATNSAGATNVSYYFRHMFTGLDVASYTNLLVRLSRDDGGVVYLNGTEVFRSNMPPGPVDRTTRAAAVASDDGMLIYASPANAGLLRVGNNVVAVEVHQAAPVAGTTAGPDLSFDLELQANVLFEHPAVTLTSPADGAVLGSAHLAMRAQADDQDGAVAMVEFYVNGVQLGTATNTPFEVTASNVVSGAYVLAAVAVDNTGLSVTSAPVRVTVAPRLVPSSAVWRYLDDGSDPGPNWASPSFDDAGWSNGVAQLGFGDGDEGTPLRQFSTLTGQNVITYYFRRAFDLPTRTGISNLVVRLIRDDGAIVRLNGTEVFRINMDPGPVGPMSFATQKVDIDHSFHAIRVDPALLATGRNVVAVEMHQFNLTSSDLSFDLQLLPNVLPAPPQAALVAPTNGSVFLGPIDLEFTALAYDFDQPVTSLAFLINGVSAGTDTTDNYEVEGWNFSMVASNLDAGNYAIRTVARDAGGLMSTSSPVAIQILYAPVLTPFVSTGSLWKYFDAGIDQGTAWRGRDFDDAAWPSGRGKFGTNDPAATIIRVSPANLTTYLRYHFPVTYAASYTNLLFRVLRDDGVVVYVNGVEVFRNNMPPGPVWFSTPALNPIGGVNESLYEPTNTPAGALVVGDNVLAVELHQYGSTGNMDAGFDLALTGFGLPTPIAPALNIYPHAGTLLVTWPGTGFRLEEAPALTGPYVTRATGTNAYAIPNLSGNRFYRLVK